MLGESGAPVSSLPSVDDHSFEESIDRDDNLIEGRIGEKPVVVQEIPTKRTRGNSVFLVAIIVMINFVASSKVYLQYVMRDSDDDNETCKILLPNGGDRARGRSLMR
jgi:hypothetical protein